MKSGSARLRQRIADLEALDTTKIASESDPVIEGLQQRIESTVADIFGPDSHEYSQLRMAWYLDATEYLLSIVPDWAGNHPRGPSVAEIQEGVAKGRDRAIALLRGSADSLDEAAAYASPSREEAAKPQPRTISREIFIVHGRDTPAKVEVARLIERAGLTAVILHEMPNSGRTIIEKFEAHGASAGFAVVVLTPDDVGGISESPPDQLKPRARQNVIGEMFWFTAQLGRRRVCALKKGEIELPSDFIGVGYTDMDDRGAWKMELLKELTAAGYTVEWGKALA